MRRALLLVLCVAAPSGAQSRDSTIYTATRIITSTTGKITSVSVTKVAPPAAGRVDTLIWQSNRNARGDSLVFTGPFRYSPISGGPAVPPAFPLPVRVVPGPAVHDTLPMVWAPNTNAARDSVLWYGPYAWPTNSRPANFKLPLGPATHDTVQVIVVVHDTIPVTPPPAPNRPGAPELPRGMAAMDSMIASSRALMNQTVFADTLYQFHLPNGAWEWRCKGPGCATPGMRARLLTMKKARR